MNEKRHRYYAMENAIMPAATEACYAARPVLFSEAVTQESLPPNLIAKLPSFFVAATASWQTLNLIPNW